ncbi:MAG TPA: sigma-70 family RNA polymerase sigma factor [Bryobacteraceae bacterium]|nr:sigma-70 family RNA polymerase sigma factor [Bryobacteraceae bacterium]
MPARANLHPPVNLDSAEPGSLENEVVALFDQWRGKLLRYTLRIGVTVQDGEEVIQETFLSLFRHLQSGKSRENLQGWLFRVAHNLALRRCQRSRSSPEALDGLDMAAIDPSPGPEAQFSDSQTRERLLAVVHALPEQDRRCLFLRAEGLRYREIAAVLDISLGAVSLSLSRSLARIGRAAER